MGKIILEVNNNKTRLSGSLKILNQLDKDFAIRHPNAFFLRRTMGRGWDGKQHYLTQAGYIKTGLLPKMINKIKEHGHDVEIHDYRETLPKPIMPKIIGEHTPRPYQEKAIKSIINNHIGDFYFPMGVINAATNAGKTTIAAGIWEAYNRDVPAILLINDGDLYNQFLDEIPKLVGKENFGYIRGKDIKFNKFTIAMVQTLTRRTVEFARELSNFGICLVDEADLADNKTYKRCIEKLYNTSVRVGLSGTIYMSKLAKDKLKNENLRCFLSDEVFTITKREMIDKGFSTELVVKIIKGNIKPGMKGSYQEEYKNLITNNDDRHLVSAKRTEWNLNKGRLPALIVCQFHEHIDNMEKVYREYFGNKYRIVTVHHETKNRKQIFQDCRDGKIDILISSFIVKRGKNLPLLKYMQNAAGGDSNETISQLMGRMERKHQSKSKSYIDDLWDDGYYLKRHSNHRVVYYKKEKIKVINYAKR